MIYERCSKLEVLILVITRYYNLTVYRFLQLITLPFLTVALRIFVEECKTWSSFLASSVLHLPLTVYLPSKYSTQNPVHIHPQFFRAVSL